MRFRDIKVLLCNQSGLYARPRLDNRPPSSPSIQRPSTTKTISHSADKVEDSFPSNMTGQPHKSAADLISSLPLIRYLRQSQQRHDAYQELRPYTIMHPNAIPTHLVSGSLFTPNKLPVAPYFFTRVQPVPSLIAACYIGTHLTGHAGFVHGGMHFLLFDDAFAYCASQLFKSRAGMTANLQIDFRQPSPPDRVYVYRCMVEKMEGRKAYIVGEMRSLNAFRAEEMLRRPVANGDGPSEEEREGTLVAEARALFIEPRDKSSMLPLYPEPS